MSYIQRSISSEARRLLDEAHKEASYSDMLFYILEAMVKSKRYNLTKRIKFKDKKFVIVIEQDLEGDK